MRTLTFEIPKMAQGSQINANVYIINDCWVDWEATGQSLRQRHQKQALQQRWSGGGVRDARGFRAPSILGRAELYPM